MAQAGEQTGETVQPILRALAAGDLLKAADLADGCWARSRTPDVGYLRVLARARMGDLSLARKLYAEVGLPHSQELDHRALGARLLKDEAFAAGPEAAEMFLAAADAYAGIFAATNDPYPGVNAASLMLFAGRGDRAQQLAQALLGHERLSEPSSYFDLVTVAEALLLLGRSEESFTMLDAATTAPDADIGARASTRRQLTRLAQVLRLSEEKRAKLDQLLGSPTVIHFCGSAGDAAEEELASAIDEYLKANSVQVAYGGIGSAAELAIAERLLRQDAELNLVLPFSSDDYLPAVASGDRERLERLQRCVSEASSVSVVTTAPFRSDSNHDRHARDIAMGLAKARAAHLDAQVRQLAVTIDGSEPADAQVWRQFAGKTAFVPVGGAVDSAFAEVGRGAADRSIKAILFADFPSFSTVPEENVPIFWREVMQRIATVLDRHSGAVRYRNTWGDAIYVIIATAADAAAIALELLEELSAADHAALGVTGETQMRIGLHLGPIYEGLDFVTGDTTYYGRQVSLAARIEPITPAGAVFVTEAFAAVLALRNVEGYGCEYVGVLDLPKGYGRERMYRLTRVNRIDWFGAEIAS